jgi:excisionase family DNA binding protein
MSTASQRHGNKAGTGNLQDSSLKNGGCQLWDAGSLAEALGVELRFVRRLVAERRIPFVKVGRYVRFDPAEVRAWVDQRRVPMSELDRHWRR